MPAHNPRYRCRNDDVSLPRLESDLRVLQSFIQPSAAPRFERQVHMNYTLLHIVVGVLWFDGLPLLVFALTSSGALLLRTTPAGQLALAWSLGLAVIFGSWVWRDASAHGCSRNVAVAFTAACVVFWILAIFPYLFVSRGAKGGLVASLKLGSLVIASVFVLSRVIR